MFRANRSGKTMAVPKAPRLRAPRALSASKARDGFSFASKDYNTDAWKTCQAEVKERDGNRCVYCGATKDLHAHHIRSKSKGGTDDKRNVITACEPCHERFHSHLRKRRGSS